MDMYSFDTTKAWKSKLVAEWYRIDNQLWEHNIRLKLPAIEIVDKRWGQYVHASGGEPTIQLSRELLNNFGWGAITHVLRHEVAHYIVDVAWHMGDLDAHGEAFVKACGLLGVDARRCSSAKDLTDEDAEQRFAVVSKIKKVMALTSSSEKGEAENALRKAELLMLKHNIESLDERKPDEYIFRPVGPLMRKMPNYARDLANLIKEFYFINHILCYCGCSKERYFEFFGTKENVDIAEYIYCCLLRQAETLWKEHSKEMRSQYGGVRGIASKACFIEGLIAGYSRKLHEQKEERERGSTMVSSNEALIWTGDPLLEEMYRKAYPTARNRVYSRNAVGGGYADGFKRGQNLSLNAGLHSGNANGMRGRLLNA